MVALTKQPYPAIDMAGWVLSPASIADRVLSDFFLAEYSQTELWPGKVKSFPYLIRNRSGGINIICSEVQDALTEIYSQYFYDVVCQVTYKEEASDINAYQLVIYSSFKDALGTEYLLSRIAAVMDGKITAIIAAINGD